MYTAGIWEYIRVYFGTCMYELGHICISMDNDELDHTFLDH
jgi:hypothetical protein